MNGNDVINIINEVAARYQLTQMQIQNLITKYHNDTRDIGLLKKEIERSGGFYQTQNKLNTIIINTPPIQQGCNYYVTTFDNKGHLVLQPVSITITSPSQTTIEQSLWPTSR